MANGDLKRGDGPLLKKAKKCEVVFDPAELKKLRAESQQHYDEMKAKMEVGSAMRACRLGMLRLFPC